MIRPHYLLWISLNYNYSQLIVWLQTNIFWRLSSYPWRCVGLLKWFPGLDSITADKSGVCIIESKEIKLLYWWNEISGFRSQKFLRCSPVDLHVYFGASHWPYAISTIQTSIPITKTGYLFIARQLWVPQSQLRCRKWPHVLTAMRFKLPLSILAF